MNQLPDAGFVDLLRELTQTPGIAGHEDAIARQMAGGLGRYADHVQIDSLGNVIARLGDAGAAPRIAVLAHMDTVGFLVKRFNPDRTLGVVPVGGVNLKALPGSAVRVGDLPGVIDVRAQHLAQPGDLAVTADDLAVQIDPGVAPGIVITTPVTYAPQFTALGGGLVCAPYLDNRAGCAVLWKLAAQLAADPPPGAVYLIGTVQEETTCAGAMCVLQAVMPDAAIFVDATLAYDTPGTHGRGAVQLGGGPVLTAFLYVSGLNGWHAHPGLRAHLQHNAAAQGIPVQQDAIRGLMSDARAASWLGIPSALVGLPMRGKHAPLETIHLDDLEHAVSLLAAALRHPLADLSRG
ncbi:MAG: M20/M25/M40 family metallo-hydrolase [Anaerolineae bacterium]|nr:M20/M25/M40 family metallo-hydrolase [Anaerolineae bacterium]